MGEKLTAPQVLDSGVTRGLLYALRGRHRFLDTLPIGRSVLGREIFGLLLGGGGERVLVAAAFHGQEWLTALAAALLRGYLRRAGKDGGCEGSICGRRWRSAAWW